VLEIITLGYMNQKKVTSARTIVSPVITNDQPYCFSRTKYPAASSAAPVAIGMTPGLTPTLVKMSRYR